MTGGETSRQTGEIDRQKVFRILSNKNQPQIYFNCFLYVRLVMVSTKVMDESTLVKKRESFLAVFFGRMRLSFEEGYFPTISIRNGLDFFGARERERGTCRRNHTPRGKDTFRHIQREGDRQRGADS